MRCIVTSTLPLQAPATEAAGGTTTGPAVVTKRAGKEEAEPTAAAVAAPPPDNYDRKLAPKKPAIVTTTSRKQLKLERASRREKDRPDDPEAAARVMAFLVRMLRQGGALPPEKP
jgi:hypothetical protein